MDGATHDDGLSHLVKLFEEADSATREARQLAERDRDYYDNKQWTATEKTALEKRGQPVVTMNHIAPKVRSLKGMEQQTRKDPKAFPRTPGDDGAAQAATDALRYICDDSDWDQVRSEAYENIIIEGTGIVFVGAKQSKQGVDPSLTCVPWDRFFHDPHSRRHDFGDAAYMGIITWMDVEAAKAKFKGKEDIVEGTWADARDSDTYDDRPKHQLWADHKRKRVRIIEMYYRKSGQWYACTFTKMGHLVEPSPSPYLDEDGQPENPIKASSAYIDRDNNRYGEVRLMISPQDEINKRRSKGLHLINSRQTRISRNVAMDASEVKRELAKPDGVFFGDKDDVEILPTGDMAAANLEMLQEAKNEISLLSANASLQGKNEKDLSGRAILAQQQAGMVEVAVLMDRLRSLSLAVYRSIWARIRQYWKEERWVRVTDDPRAPRFVGINQPRTMLQVAEERLQGDPEAQMKLAMLARDPMAQQPIEVQNQVSELDVDILIDEGVDTPTVQAEQFDTLTKIMPSVVNLPPPYLEVLIEASSLRDKDKLLEKVAKLAQQPQIPPELQQQIQDGQKRLQELEGENQQLKADQSTKMAAAQMDAENARQKAEMDAQLEAQKAQAKAHSDIAIARINAATKIEVARITAAADAAIAEDRLKSDHAVKMQQAKQKPEPRQAA